MSTVPTLERRTTTVKDDWVVVAPPRRFERLTSANVVIAISRSRASLDDGIVIDTTALRPLDDMDVDAADLASQRWDD